eukprot:TRINITY_DN4016_c0_g1_i1.p1 TRINITY_DN4016_c0_g1~~TRINITY_DN4016_c0_g1_i1.p1  ORF type:complete len:482 (-),score=110.40 TRINITY_DN4016_c0_g1_i1:27-1472(-)
MILYILLSVVLLALFYLLKHQKKRSYLEKYGIQNPYPAYPVIGNLPTVLARKDEPLGTLMMMKDGFKTLNSDVLYLDVGMNIMVVLNNPELAQVVYKSPDRDDSLIDSVTMASGAVGTFNLNGEEWLFHRRHSAPILKKMNMRNVSWVFEECCQKLMNVLNSEIGNPIELSQIMNEFTFDVIGLVAFGVDFHSLDHQQNDVLESFKTALDHFGVMFDNPLIKLIWNIKQPNELLKAKKILKEKAEYVIKDKIKRLEQGESPSEKEDLTDMLLSTYDLKDTQGLIGEILTFLLAGSETSSSTLAYLLYTLSRHPEIQQKAYEEIISKVGNRPITFDDIESLEYVKCCLDEAARLYTVAPMNGRKITRDIVRDGKVIIPKGEFVAITVYLLHTDPEVWENPHEYNPERFLNLTEAQKISFTPFGGGKRVCIGKALAEIEIVWLTAMIIQNYILEPVSDVWPIPMKFALTTKSMEDLVVKFEKR